MGSSNISENLPESLKHSMKVFQAKNNIPVFLKGGPMDKALFGLTVGLCGIGVLSFAKLVFDMGFSKKKN